MSYPGAVGYATNLACDTALQRSTDQFNFQLNTGGGGSSVNNLVSPANITNNTVSDPTTLTFNGPSSFSTDTTMSLTLDSVSASEIFQISTGSNTIPVVIDNTALFVRESAVGNTIVVDPFYNGIVASGSSIQFGDVFSVQKSGVGPTYLSVDTSNNNVTLGDLASAGTINLDAATVIKDSTAPGNALLLSPSSAISSLISQTVASGGTVTIGSSAAAPNTLVVSDGGANTAGVFIGGNSGASLVIKGGVGSAPPTIFPNVSDAGTLQIGSSSSVQNSIVLTDSAGVDTGRTVINNFVPPTPTDSGILLITIPVGQTDLPQPNPLVSGLYIFAVSPGTNDVRIGVTTMAYYNVASATWRVGGSVYGIPVGAGNVSLLPKNDQSVMTVSNTTGGALALANVVYCRLFTGTIGGW